MKQSAQSPGRGARRRGVIACSRIAVGAPFFSLNTLVHVLVLLTVALVKPVVRARAVRRVCDRVLMSIAESWVAVNASMIRGMTRLQHHRRVERDVERDQALRPGRHPPSSMTPDSVSRRYLRRRFAPRSPREKPYKLPRASPSTPS